MALDLPARQQWRPGRTAEQRALSPIRWTCFPRARRPIAPPSSTFGVLSAGHGAGTGPRGAGPGTLRPSILKDPAPRMLMLGTEPGERRGPLRRAHLHIAARGSHRHLLRGAHPCVVCARSSRHPRGLRAGGGWSSPPAVRSARSAEPSVVPAALIAAGRITALRAGRGDPSGCRRRSSPKAWCREDMLDGGLDVERALASLSETRDSQRVRLAASAQSEIAKQATAFPRSGGGRLAADHSAALTERPVPGLPGGCHPHPCGQGAGPLRCPQRRRGRSAASFPAMRSAGRASSASKRQAAAAAPFRPRPRWSPRFAHERLKALRGAEAGA